MSTPDHPQESTAHSPLQSEWPDIAIPPRVEVAPPSAIRPSPVPLHWTSKALVVGGTSLLAFGPTLVQIFQSTGSSAAGAGTTAFNSFVAITLIALILAPVYVFTRRRAPNVPAIAFGSLTLFIGLVTVLYMAMVVPMGPEYARASASLPPTPQADPPPQPVPATVPQASTATPNDANRPRTNAEVEAMINKADGDDRLFYRAVQAFGHNHLPSMLSYNDALTLFTKAGALDIPSMKSREDIAARVALLDQMIEHISTSATLEANMSEFVRKQMRDAGSTTADTYPEVARFAEARKLDLEFFTAERELCKSMRTYLIILRDAYPHWARAGNSIEFTDEAPAGSDQQLTDAASVLNTAIEHQTRVSTAREERDAKRKRERKP